VRYLLIPFFFIFTFVYSQNIIDIKNKSFEDVDIIIKKKFNVKYWSDCGRINFGLISAPDIHKSNNKKEWGVIAKASDGENFLGLVVRDDMTYESISQKLTQPMKKGRCYRLCVDLARSEFYLSHSILTKKEENYITPCVLKLYGGYENCSDAILLAKTGEIHHFEWKNYEFNISTVYEIDYITLEAYYYNQKTDQAYNGNILIDNLSDLEEIDCKKNKTITTKNKK
jgi:hypothetical protein